VGYKERQKVAGDLKQIYQSMTEEEAWMSLNIFIVSRVIVVKLWLI
jgi:hypothetical protein